MLEQVCDFIHNYFVLAEYEGTYEVENGTFPCSFLLDGQRFRIRGSALNDGIYTYHLDGTIYDDDDSVAIDLMPETFNGIIQVMGVPRTFLLLVKDISNWIESNSAALNSPYTSESFGGYSYTKATGTGANAGGILGWQDVFKQKLNAYRKLA